MRKKKLVKSIVAVGLSACMVVGSTSVAFAKGTGFEYDADGNKTGTTGHVDADGHVATDYWYELDKDGNMQYDEDGNVIKELIKKDDEEKCDHVWVKRLTKSPTCTEEGEWTIFCGNCGESKTESIAATGHSWGDWTVTKAASCTEDGEEERTCSTCGDTETKTIPATGHKWTATSEETKAPTCTEDGYTKKTCGTCGETVTTTIPATGHKWTATSEETKEPTCTEDGYTKKTCGVCGKTETTTIPATGHKWTATSVETKEPTCTEDGYTKKTCGTCGETETTTIPATGHTPVVLGTDKGQAPTCTEAGWTDTVRCATCGEILSSSVEIPATGHKVAATSDWEVTKEATCTENGLKVKKCMVCGEVAESEVILAKGHGEEYTKGTEKGYAATCTEAGKTDVVRCKDCDAVLKEAEPISALGHKKNATTTVTVVKEATCTEEGEVSYKCTHCHETITEKTPIDPDNHVWTATGSCKNCHKKKPATAEA